MLRTSMPAVGIHSSAIACGMILDEGYLEGKVGSSGIVRLRCLFGGFGGLMRGGEKRRVTGTQIL